MVVEQCAARIAAIAAGAAGLLVISFKCRRHLKMKDEADVRLVDAHAKSIGGDHDGRSPGDEGFLGLRALPGGETPVVEQRFVAGLTQPKMNLRSRFYRCRIYNAGARNRAH